MRPRERHACAEPCQGGNNRLPGPLALLPLRAMSLGLRFASAACDVAWPGPASFPFQPPRAMSDWASWRLDRAV
eukprot:12386131-Alexandrium_andersonii.AAC.1